MRQRLIAAAFVIGMLASAPSVALAAGGPAHGSDGCGRAWGQAIAATAPKGQDSVHTPGEHGVPGGIQDGFVMAHCR